MAAQGPRVNLTLDADLVDILDRMGRITGAGKATLIKGWLEGMKPQLKQLLRALELAEQQNVDAVEAATDVLQKLAEDSSQMTLDLEKKGRSLRRKQGKKAS